MAEKRLPKEEGQKLEPTYLNPFIEDHPYTWTRKKVFREYLATRDDVPIGSDLYQQLLEQHGRVKRRRHAQNWRRKVRDPNLQNFKGRNRKGQSKDGSSNSESESESDDGDNSYNEGSDHEHDGDSETERRETRAAARRTEKEGLPDRKPTRRAPTANQNRRSISAEEGKALEPRYLDPFIKEYSDNWFQKRVFVEYLAKKDEVQVGSDLYNQLILQHKRAKDRHYNEHLRIKVKAPSENDTSSGESFDEDGDGERERTGTRGAAKSRLSTQTRRGTKRKNTGEDFFDEDDEDEDDNDEPVKPSPKARKRLVHNGGRHGERTAPQATTSWPTPARVNLPMSIMAFPPTKEEKDALLAGINTDKDQFPCKNFFFLSLLSFLLGNPPNIVPFW